MKKTLLLAILCLMLSAPQLQAAEHRIGGGANYWVAIDDIDTDNIDDNGISIFGSYQYWAGLFGLEFDVDLLPDRFGETAFAPEAYVLVGRAIYAGVGIGITYSDGDFADEPFYALKAGINLELLPDIYVDIFANYHFNDSAEFDNLKEKIDTDTVFLGAAVRFSL